MSRYAQVPNNMYLFLCSSRAPTIYVVIIVVDLYLLRLLYSSDNVQARFWVFHVVSPKILIH